MGESRPIASLTANLLARKGTARPAMRSPLQITDPDSPRVVDDLGWNDFGPAVDPQVHDLHEGVRALPVEVPPVVRQQQAIAGRLTTKTRRTETDAGKPASDGTVARAARKSALAQGRRAAFTLRVDAQRHLALRLAATLAGRSAQVLLTEALDRMLAESPEVAALLAQIKPRR